MFKKIKKALKRNKPYIGPIIEIEESSDTLSSHEFAEIVGIDVLCDELYSLSTHQSQRSGPPRLDMALFTPPDSPYSSLPRNEVHEQFFARERRASEPYLSAKRRPSTISIASTTVEKRGRFEVTLEKSAHSSPGTNRWMETHGQSRFTLVDEKKEVRSNSVDSGVSGV